MADIKIEKMIFHQIEFTKGNPNITLFDRVMDLKSIPQEAIDFFSKHISGALITKQIKNCKFTNKKAAVLQSCEEISKYISDEKVFIDNTKLITQKLFDIMLGTSSRSSGTLIFILFHLNQKRYLSIMKMDPNKAIQVDLKSYAFKVQKDILPSVNEKLHKCAFIELIPNIWDQPIHSFVLDKQKLAGEPAHFFLKGFLESDTVMDNKKNTEIVSKKLKEFVIVENIVPKEKLISFHNQINKMLTSGNEVDIDRDLESLFKTYIPGEADRTETTDEFKTRLKRSHPDALFEFTADRVETVATLSDRDKKIKIQFPVSYMDTFVKIDYKEEENGDFSTIIKFVGKKLEQNIKYKEK
ncbi:nucleoid-associated protein [Brevibacillus laterosporus]|uniref:nucleoid-associated protein n=1 Tax=Brevibacillus laterosporus TaxID=1465 RepID=UPI000839D5F0|nr:nucleoid-associated protein [Brevibacillus laterosporus]